MRHRLYTLTGLLLIAVSCAWAQISEQRLFTIPYGTGKDQLAVPPLREEIESVPTQAPIVMRRTQTGDFVIVSYRRGDGVVLQVFNAEGQLRSYAQLANVDPAAPLTVYEGNVYSFLYAVPADLKRDELMQAFRSDGKPVPLDEVRHRLVAVLKEIRFDGFGEPVVCGDSLHIPVYCRSDGATHRKLITLTKSGDIEISDLPLYGYPMCLPGGELGVLEFDSPEENTGITLRQRTVNKTVCASLKEEQERILDICAERGLHFPFLAHSWSLVAKNNSLIIFYLARYENNNTALGFPVNTKIMTIIDSKGQLVKRIQFDTPVGTLRVWDTDNEGNIYYLAFTKEGAEMRKLVIR